MEPYLTTSDKIKLLFKRLLCRINIHIDCHKTEGYQMYCSTCGSYWQYSHRYKIILIGKKGRWDY